MEHLYSYKNVKQDGKKNNQDLNVKVNQRMGALQKGHPFLKNTLFSYLQDDRAEKKLYLENQKKKKWGLYHSKEELLRSICQTKVKPKSKLLRTLDFGGLPQTTNVKAREGLYHSRGAPLVSDKRQHALALSRSFVNLIMIDGKKSQAEKIFSQTLKKLAPSLQDHVKKEVQKKREVIPFERKQNTASRPISSLEKTGREVVSCLVFSPEKTPQEESFLIVNDKMEKRSVYHLLQKAIDHVKPTLQVRKVRIARSIYQVPFIMKRRRQERNAIRWIIESAKKRSRHSGVAFSECLASCVLEAFMGQGEAREKRDQLHRTAEANRGYLRYRWW